MANEKTTGLSMLDKLASGIMDDKAVKGAKLAPALTPVAGEVRTPAAFPNDVPLEQARYIRDALVQQRDALQAVITGLNLLLGDVVEDLQAAAKDEAALAVKLAEKEADRRAADQAAAAAGDPRAAKREAVIAAMMAAGDGDENPVAAMVAAGDEAEESFDARMKRLGDEAKAAAFSSPTVPAASGDGWSCPTHGTTNLIVKTSPRRAVQFTKCAVVDCHEFERV